MLVMKLLLSVLLGFMIFLFYAKSSLAINNPLDLPNNRFGIHIFSEKDLEEAAKLVNSKGGDWGYVTLVITEAERDKDRWQKVFDEMRRLHLIPIIRIATKAEGSIWQKPKIEEIDNWVNFLNSLNWVIENRYVIIANEPNHSYEWGGDIDPGEYATYLKEFSHKLKNSSSDFFVLPAALDASAPNGPNTMEESKYIFAMLKKVPEVFDFIDGWNSHSYPNPDFSGKETATGKGTVKTFEWEISFLKSIGITKDFPIFITETGWSQKKINQDEISSKYLYAFDKVWNSDNIVAITPFILNYPQEPFGHFSWKNQQGEFYSFYHEIINIPKEQGEPKQKVSGDIVAAFVQPVIFEGHEFVGTILAKNTGQSIWNFNQILIGANRMDTDFKANAFGAIEPTKLGLIVFKAASPRTTGVYSTSLFLTDKKGAKITNDFDVESVIIKFSNIKVENYFDKAANFVKSFF